jgi:hypothetical protein
VYVKVREYAKVHSTLDFGFGENNATITLDPDAGVRISSIPTTSSSLTIESISCTAEAAVNAIVYDAINPTLTNGSNADTLHKHAEVTEQRASTQMKIWYGTTAQYTAIGTKDANTIYICS